ncbi:MAG: hypothetical protein KHZ82_02325 [Peptoniphilus harei]|nr:hypothetical protein [Peptoniphilus harei]
MAKLKFDRIVRILGQKGEKITVPADEVWKGTLLYGGELFMNDNRLESVNSISSGGKYMFNPILPNIILGGGTKFYSASSFGTSFTGVAFKVI